MRCVPWTGLLFGLLSWSLRAEDGSLSPTRSGQKQEARTWSMTVDARLAPAFQLTLGGYFDPGPSVQTRWTSCLSHLFRAGDKLTVSALQAVSAPRGYVNWHAGVYYQHRLGRTGAWSWDATAGLERWRFPSVLRGTQDWAAVWTLTSRRDWRGVTWTATADGRNNFVSNMPRGTLLVTTLTASHTLWRAEKGLLTVHHGPMYSHSWGMYGTHGPRVFRYSGTLAWSTPQWSAEVGYRPQAALSSGVPHYHYWSFGISYRLSRRLQRSAASAEP